MSEVQVWSDVQVNVESARAAAKTISAVTLATPGVFSSTAHGYNNGDLLLLALVGMRELDEAVVKVTAKTTDTFQVAGLDDGAAISTLAFSAFVSGTAEKLTFGAVADAITDVSAAGGDAADINVTTIHNSQDRSIPGNFAALIYTLGAQWKPSDPALAAMRAAARTKATKGVEFVFADGTAVYMAAKPSTSLAPGGSAGAIVTTSAKLSVQGPLSFFPV